MARHKLSENKNTEKKSNNPIYELCVYKYICCCSCHNLPPIAISPHTQSVITQTEREKANKKNVDGNLIAKLGVPLPSAAQIAGSFEYRNCSLLIWKLCVRQSLTHSRLMDVCVHTKRALTMQGRCVFIALHSLLAIP